MINVNNRFSINPIPLISPFSVSYWNLYKKFGVYLQDFSLSKVLFGYSNNIRK